MSDFYEFDPEPKKQKEDEQTRLNREKQELEDLAFVLSSPQGRRFVWSYLQVNRVLKISADASGSMTYFKEGIRNSANKMFAQILKAAPEAYIQMMKEAKGEIK